MKKLVSKRIVGIFLLLFTAYHLCAQYSISGKVVQDGEQNREEIPLEFANIILSTPDSVYVAGTNSDLNGRFELKNVPSGNYLLSISYIGFSPKEIVLNNLAGPLKLGNIFMAESENELGAVTVSASNVVNRTDGLIVFVTDRQKQHSSNGVNILTTMQLPRLTVNPVTNDVTLPGDGKIQFCINGRNVTKTDIMALQPAEIIRIEYLNNPGLRYGGADAVINYILKRAISGGRLSMDTGTAITTGFSDDQIAAKINYGKSEFGVNYSLRYRKPSKLWADKEQIFNFEDGSSFTRFSDGLSSDFEEQYHDIGLNYSMLDKEDYFNVTLRHSILNNNKRTRSLQYTTHDANNITDVYQGSKTRQLLPSLDLYYSRSLKNKQTLVFNVVGTYINSAINQIYEETEENQTIADIISDVDGNKYSIIGEGIYEKIFENNNRFTSGLKYTQTFADNRYTGTENSLAKMNQSDAYIYAEYAGRKNKFSYIGGIGLSYSRAGQEGENDYSSYIFRPKFTLQYDFTDKLFVRLMGEIYTTAPSLANLSAVSQYIDTLQIMRGNPSLKPNLNYRTDLQAGWKKGIYGINLYSSYIYSPKPIMDEILREDNMFVQTYANQKNWQKLNSELSFSAGPVKNFLMVSLTGGVNHYISNGNTYSHTHTNFYYRAQVVAMYKKVTGVFQINSANNNFWGETLNGGENMHLFMLSYNTGKISAGAGVLLPFSDNYKRYTENRNIYRPFKGYAYSNDFSRMILLKFAWNFDFGKKAESKKKRTNYSDTDAGIMTAY